MGLVAVPFFLGCRDFSGWVTSVCGFWTLAFSFAETVILGAPFFRGREASGLENPASPLLAPRGPMSESCSSPSESESEELDEDEDEDEDEDDDEEEEPATFCPCRRRASPSEPRAWDGGVTF